MALRPLHKLGIRPIFGEDGQRRQTLGFTQLGSFLLRVMLLHVFFYVASNFTSRVFYYNSTTTSIGASSLSPESSCTEYEGTPFYEGWRVVMCKFIHELELHDYQLDLGIVLLQKKSLSWKYQTVK